MHVLKVSPHICLLEHVQVLNAMGRHCEHESVQYQARGALRSLARDNEHNRALIALSIDNL